MLVYDMHAQAYKLTEYKDHHLKQKPYSNQTKMQINNHQEFMSGYSFIEISISMIVIGVMSLSLFQLVQTLQHAHKEQLTKYRQQIVLKALGEYVYKHSYLPYPCHESENHIGLSQNHMSLSDTTTHIAADQNDEQQFDWSSINAVGTVPWRTLGISRESTLDGYGQPMIYIMNTALGPAHDILYIPSENKRGSTHHKLISDFRSIYTNFFYRKKYISQKSSDHEKLRKETSSATSSQHHTSTQHDMLYESKYDNFISLCYYELDSHNQYVEYDMYNTNGEHVVLLPISANENLTTVDCVAVVLISCGSISNQAQSYKHNTVNHTSKEAENNLKITKEHKTPFNYDHIKIYLNSPEHKFQQKIVYVTRFGFHLYGGPVLNNHHTQKRAHMQTDLRRDL